MHERARVAPRQTEAEVQDASPSGEAQEQTADMATAELLAFWGWDCCGPGGILDRMYQALQVRVRVALEGREEHKGVRGPGGGGGSEEVVWLHVQVASLRLCAWHHRYIHAGRGGGGE